MNFRINTLELLALVQNRPPKNAELPIKNTEQPCKNAELRWGDTALGPSCLLYSNILGIST